MYCLLIFWETTVHNFSNYSILIKIIILKCRCYHVKSSVCICFVLECMKLFINCWGFLFCFFQIEHVLDVVFVFVTEIKTALEQIINASSAKKDKNYSNFGDKWKHNVGQALGKSLKNVSYFCVEIEHDFLVAERYFFIKVYIQRR